MLKAEAFVTDSYLRSSQKFVGMDRARESSIKYSWPPCINYFISPAFYTEKNIFLLTKQPILINHTEDSPSVRS
jgi:hypothetical protein